MRDKLFRNLNVIIFFLLLSGSLGAAILEQVNTTAVQTMTNKTLTSPTLTTPTISSPTFSGTASGTLTSLILTAPSLTVNDDSFTLRDGVGTTKTGLFQLSGLTAPSTRIWTMPDASTAIVGTDVTQTLSGKTLASPVFSGTYTLGEAATLNSTVTTGHSLGSSSALAGMNWFLTKTGPGSSNVYGLNSNASLTGGISDNIIGHSFNSSLTKAGSGTHALIDNVFIGAPSIGGSATGTTASSLRISGAPASGATNLYALYVAGGTSLFSGLLDLGAGQLKFPASQNDSANANTLDDYEEGTWTPSLGGSATYTTQYGRYTKIGRLVTASFGLVVNAIGTGSTSTVSGLPFAAATGMDFPASIGFVSGAASNFIAMYGRAPSAGTTIVFFASAVAAAGNSTISTIFGSGTSLTASVTYIVP